MAVCDATVALRPLRCRDHTFAVDFSRDGFIHVAPDPSFTGLNRTDERVLCSMKVLRRVLVLGGVAATDMAALQAQPQVNPAVSHFYAFFADVSLSFCEVNVIQMFALAHDLISLFQISSNR